MGLGGFELDYFRAMVKYGQAASEESKNINKDASQSAAAGDHAGEKKVEVYIDDQNNPYFYEGHK